VVSPSPTLEFVTDGTFHQPYRDLLTLIAGKPLTPLSPRSPEDSSALLDQLLVSWQVLPSITETQMEGVLAPTLVPQDYFRLRHAWLAVTAFSRAQNVVGQQLLRALEKHGTKYCLLKGSATAFLLYPEPHMRTGWDLDIGVDPSNLRQVEVLARGVGYQAAQQDPKTNRFYHADPKFRATVEAAHYELGFLVRRLQVTNLPSEILEAIRMESWTWQYWFDIECGVPCCYASVDIHHALSLDIALDDLLAHARTLTINGLTLRVPDDAWLVAHLVFKIYWEGVHSYRKGLYGYADLVRLASRLDASTFERVVTILERYKLLAAGHYVLRRLPLFGVSLPDHILSFIVETGLAPTATDPILINDLGDMWPKIWGKR
jgi:hypothetical protein